MSTDRATGGDELIARQIYDGEEPERPKKMNADDAYEDMLDRLKGDDMKGLVNHANDVSAKQTDQDEMAQQLLLGEGGTVTKGDPRGAYTHLGAQRRAASGQGTAEIQPPLPSEDDELQRIRAARIDQMQNAHRLIASGHGKLRELHNEADFIGVVRPRERAVVLLSDRDHDRSVPDVTAALEELAKKHVEAQFCHLELSNAGILSAILNLDEGLPVVYVLKHGEVTCALPPARLFSLSSASSPMFPKHLASLLRKVGGIGSGADDANSDSGCESEEEENRRRRVGAYRR